MYKYTESNATHYSRWMKNKTLKIGRTGKDLIPKHNNYDRMTYSNNKKHRYWIEMSLAIILLRLIDTNKANRLAEEYEINYIPADLKTFSSKDYKAEG